MGNGDWTAMASVLAAVVAVLALQATRQAALAARQQAAVMAQQASGEEGGQPWLNIVGTRWRRNRLELEIRQLSGLPLAEIHTFTRLAGATTADDGEPAVWRDSAQGAGSSQHPGHHHDHAAAPGLQPDCRVLLRRARRAAHLAHHHGRRGTSAAVRVEQGAAVVFSGPRRLPGAPATGPRPPARCGRAGTPARCA